MPEPMAQAAAQPPFKYALKIAAYPDCPAATCQPAQGTAYRFTFDPIGNSSFTPVGDRNDAECGSWGLSMYRSEKQARKAYQKLLARYPEAPKRVGTHLAVGTLAAAHGLVSRPHHSTGHFNLHEFVGVRLAQTFQMVGAL
jgi:hypothetical protein